MYILASLVSHSLPSSIRIQKQLRSKILHACEPQRLLLALLMLPDTGGAQKRRTRGITDVFTKAVPTLAPISKEGALKGKAAREYIEERLFALSEPDRIPALVCVAYALHGMMPEELTKQETWKNVLLAVDVIGGRRTPSKDLQDLGEEIAEKAMILCGCV